MSKEYDTAYGFSKTYKQKDCRHSNTGCYDTRDRGNDGKITSIRSVCLTCGRLSRWAKVSNHTVGGGFTYTIKF